MGNSTNKLKPAIGKNNMFKKRQNKITIKRGGGGRGEGGGEIIIFKAFLP